jgi:hypothetical protein
VPAMCAMIVLAGEPVWLVCDGEVVMVVLDGDVDLSLSRLECAGSGCSRALPFWE